MCKDHSVVVTFAQGHLMFSILTHAVMVRERKIMSRQEESDALETRTYLSRTVSEKSEVQQFRSIDR